LARELVLYSPEISIELKDFMPGFFEIKVSSGEHQSKGGFWLKPSDQSPLMASPQVLQKEHDKQVSFRILDEHFLEEGNGSYEAQLINNQSGTILSWTGQLQEFKKMLAELETGNYRLELNNGMRMINCSFEVLPFTLKPLQIVPNPAGSQVHLSIPGIIPLEGARLRILNPYGETKLETDWQGEELNLVIAELHSGLYLVQVQNGSDLHSAWLQKE
jgi:hypothetical protein